MPARHDYRHQAARYDRTRGASPSILRPLRAALGSPGDRLLDIAGGTGNYAAAMRGDGWGSVTVVDHSVEMLARARSKSLHVVRADAALLPIAGASVDAVLIVSALHLVTSWRDAIAEAQRILKPGGRLAIMDYSREHLDVHWILRYFPRARAAIVPNHIPRAELLTALPGATETTFEFTDLVDASMSALCRYPRKILDRSFRMQTSFFEQLEQTDPDEASEGLRRLERDLDEGRDLDAEVAALRSRYGDGVVVGWTQPAV